VIVNESQTKQTPGVLYLIVCTPGPATAGSNVPNKPSTIPIPLQVPSGVDVPNKSKSNAE
jgi:hypothetical protein